MPKFTRIEDAAAHIIATDELYALEEVNIRGVRLKTFANAARHIGELMDLCDNYGDADFLVLEDERYTFNDFRSQVNQLANVLKDKFGVSKGDHIAICMRNCPEYLTAIMAIASLGGVIVFLNSWWTTQELEYGFTDSGAQLAFIDEPITRRINPFAKTLGISSILVRSEMSNFPSYSELLRSVQNVPPTALEIDTDEDMAIMYTSGSTGKPKGVVQTHRGAISALMSWLMSGRIAELMGTSPEMPKDKNGEDLQVSLLVTTPLFHVSATHACFLLGLAAGAKLVLMNKWDPDKAVNLIEQESVTRFFGVPTMSADMVDASVRMGRTLDTIRTLDAGGAKRPASQVAKLAKAFPLAEPRTGFGLTETNALGIGLGGNDYVQRPSVAGRLYPPLQEMKIIDNRGREVPTGDVGELTLKSAANMRCYHNQPEATSETLREGWLYTGDLAKVDADGIVTIVDRKKDIIIRGGENISCLEVDDAIHLHPSVADAAVFSMPNERLGEVVGAGVQLHASETLNETDLQDFLREHLAAFKIPEKIWFRTTLPRGGTGKTDRRALRVECLGDVASESIVAN